MHRVSISSLSLLGIIVCLWSMVYGLWTNDAFAETVTFSSALVWRGDRRGDYVFEERGVMKGVEIEEDTGFLRYKAKPGTYEIVNPVETEGVIQSLTCSWAFEGKVRIEISLNGGRDYTEVINGVPLSILDLGSSMLDVGRGNQIKWKAMLEPQSRLSEVRITYTDSTGVVSTFGNPQLSGFRVRRPIYITGSPSGILYNYQMKIKIGESSRAIDYDLHCAGHIQADFDDIRFSYQDAETLIPYYRESIRGNKPRRTAVFWMKIPQIPPEGLTIYLYYGNPKARDLSNPEEVFDFFDDFEQVDLDTDKWEVSTDWDGNFSLLDSQLRLDAAEVITKSFQIEEGVIEYRAKSTVGYEIRGIIKGSKGEGITEEGPTHVLYSSAYEGGQHSIAVDGIVKANFVSPILPSVFYNYRITLHNSQLRFERYSQDWKNKQARVSLLDKERAISGYIGLKSGGEGRGDSVAYFDWIRMRKFVNPEPVVNSLLTEEAKEEPTNLATFIGTTLAENGNLALTLEEGYTEGNYISKTIPSPYQARIMIPTYSTMDYGLSTIDHGLEIDISADGGASYRTDCKPGDYYYASRGDFSAGSNLRYRVNLPRLLATNYRLQDVIPQLKQLILDYRPGKITVLSPNGGETWMIGSSKKISWSAMEYEPTYPMRIEYSLDGGKTYNTIKEERENIGVYFWTVPHEFSDKVIVKVSDALDGSVYDTSDGTLEFR